MAVGQNHKKEDEDIRQGTPLGLIEEKRGSESNNMLKLASDQITFILPAHWTYVKGSDYCRRDAAAGTACIEEARITPGVKLTTKYGNGTEFFDIRVGVFANPSHFDAETWFEKDFQGGLASNFDTLSRQSINGYDTYLRKSVVKTSFDYEETTYVFAEEEKAVLIYARTYEPGRLPDGTSIGDFRQFEPQIAEIARSVSIRVR